MKRFFDKELELYRSQVIRMLLLCHQEATLATQALLERDQAKAVRVLSIEEEVDRLECEIDAEAARYLNLRAPIAAELRMVLSGSRMNHEFERIGDESKKIAKRVMRLQTLPPSAYLNGIQAMHDLIDHMFSDLYRAMDEASSPLASAIIREDSKIDQLNRDAQAVVIERIHRQELSLEAGLDLLDCSRALERIGDHIQNIAEILVFLISGKDVRPAVAGAQAS
jgi:phosphate transport system protein